jgi:hypothetical protein
VAFRYKLSLEIIRVFGTSATPSLVHHQNPHIAPAISPASRNNRTLDHAKKRGGSLYVYKETHIKTNKNPLAAGGGLGVTFCFLWWCFWRIISEDVWADVFLISHV